MDTPSNFNPSENLIFSDSLRIKSRALFSLQHIQSATLFTRQSYQIEKHYDGKFSDELIVDHRSYVVGAIFASVSFLEATINELFADTVDHPHSEVAKHLAPETHSLMADMWKLKIPKTASYNIVEKFQIALTLARKPLFELGRPPCQDIKILIQMRNALIHFEPTWATTIAEDFITDDSQFLGLRDQRKFSLNPLFAGTSNPFFPDKCLSHGCAKWAVASSIEFIEDFSARMSLPILLDFLRPRLKTEP